MRSATEAGSPPLWNAHLYVYLRADGLMRRGSLPASGGEPGPSSTEIRRNGVGTSPPCDMSRVLATVPPRAPARIAGAADLTGDLHLNEHDCDIPSFHHRSRPVSCDWTSMRGLGQARTWSCGNSNRRGLEETGTSTRNPKPQTASSNTTPRSRSRPATRALRSSRLMSRSRAWHPTGPSPSIRSTPQWLSTTGARICSWWITRS